MTSVGRFFADDARRIFEKTLAKRGVPDAVSYSPVLDEFFGGIILHYGDEEIPVVSALGEYQRHGPAKLVRALELLGWRGEPSDLTSLNPAMFHVLWRAV